MKLTLRFILSLAFALGFCRESPAQSRNISRVATYQSSWGEPIAAEWSNNSLYLITEAGLSKIRVGDQRRLEQVCQIQISGDRPKLIEAIDDTLVLVTETDKLIILKSTRSGNFEIMSELQLSNGISRVVLYHHYLYVLSADNGIEIVSLEDLGNPEVIGQVENLNATSRLHSLVLVDEYIYSICEDLASDESILAVFDVSDPRNPSLAATLPLSANYRDIACLNGIIYVSGGDSPSISALSITQPTRPEMLCEFANGDGGIYSGLELWGSAPGEWEFAFRAIGSSIEITNISLPSEIVHYGYFRYYNEIKNFSTRDTVIVAVTSDESYTFSSFNEALEMANYTAINQRDSVRLVASGSENIYTYSGSKVASVDFPIPNFHN